MTIRRQWEMFVSAIGLGFIVYVLMGIKTPIPPWLYGVAIGAITWGFSYNLELSKVRTNQMLEELRAIRLILDSKQKA